MKKYAFKILPIFFICILLCACNIIEGTIDKIYVSYNDKLYDSYITESHELDSRERTYNDYWYPLVDADVDGVGYLCDIDDADVTDGPDTEIKAFSDETLNMFVVTEDFWGEVLNCQMGIALPHYTDSSIEAIVLKCDSETTWKDYWASSNCIKITDVNKITILAQEFKNTIDPNNITNEYVSDKWFGNWDIGIKYEGINAIYYFGRFAYIGNVDGVNRYVLVNEEVGSATYWNISDEASEIVECKTQ